MWKFKDSEDIIHTDMEKKLAVKPTIFCDNTQTPFSDGVFDTVISDPPHFYNDKSSFYAFPDKETYQLKFKGYGDIPRYYGGDKYKTQTQLLGYVHRLQKECYRILKDEGLLWLKWNETYITINTVLALFDNWNVLLQIPVRLSNPNRTEKQTYWMCLCKKKKKVWQSQLI